MLDAALGCGHTCLRRLQCQGRPDDPPETPVRQCRSATCGSGESPPAPCAFIEASPTSARTSAIEAAIGSTIGVTMLVLEGLTKTYGAAHAVQDVSLAI